MKNFTLPAAATVLATLAVAVTVNLSSCKSAPVVAPAFDVIEKTQNLQTTTGNFEVAYRFEYLSAYSDPAVLQKTQLQMASDMFGAEYVKTDAATSAAAFDGAAVHNYGTRTESGEFRWDGYLRLHSTASLVNDRVVVYTIHRAEDAGGAHTMEETHHFNYDLRTGARLTLDALFTPEGKAALGEIIRARILKEKGVATWEELMTRDCYNPAAEVGRTDNFTLTATEITFVYNPYDIACYAAGATKVNLPLANLAGFKKEAIEGNQLKK